MNDPEENYNTPEAMQAVESPNTLRLEQARARVLHTFSTELLIKKIIWWVCAGAEVIGFTWAMIVLFSTQSEPMRFLCVVIALVMHEGMVVVVLWTILTSLRMNMLRELKGMELQLAELRVASNASVRSEPRSEG